MRNAWLLLPLLGGCYRSGALLASPIGGPNLHARQIGCLDLDVRITGDAAMRSDDPTVSLAMGNRCGHPLPVDPGRMAIRAVDARGERWELEPANPVAVPPLLLGRHARATASIPYRILGNASLAVLPLTVRVDVAQVNLEVPGAAPVEVRFRQDGYTLVAFDDSP